MGMIAGIGAPWQIEFETAEERRSYLLTSGLRSDCTFMVGPKTNQAVIPAHKLILAMASPVFEAMFYGGLSEGNEPVICVPDVQPEVFRALLPYIYTGNINITSFEMAIDLWYGANKYMLPHLVNKCNSYVMSVVGPKNACRAYEISCLFDERTLMDKCVEIISINTKEVLNDSSFENVEFKTMMTVLSLDHLNVDSELDLFYAVERYAKAEQKRQAQISSPEDAGQPSEKLSDSLETAHNEDKKNLNEECAKAQQKRTKNDHQDEEQPSEKLPKLRSPTSEEKVLSLTIENSTQSLQAMEIDSKKPAEAVTSQPAAVNENSIGVPERPIREALQKIRFLSLTPQQFAEGPALSDLLTKEESFALLMNIASADSVVPMPPGFSECRERRQPRSCSVPT